MTVAFLFGDDNHDTNTGIIIYLKFCTEAQGAVPDCVDLCSSLVLVTMVLMKVARQMQLKNQ